MALSFVDTDGTLVIPSAPAKWDVAPSASGTSTTGVVVLVGEADAGPSFSTEDVVATGGFGPNQRSAVIAKFGGGRLVDGYIMATAPSKDAGVKGAPQRIFLVKTNTGTKANVTLSAGYSKLNAKSEGLPGNLINVKVTAPGGGKATVAISRKNDGISESFTIGNNIVLTLTNIAGTVTVTATQLTSAGAATNLNITLANFKTLGDLAAFINTVAGWTATVPGMFSQLTPSALDRVTALSAVGGANIKKDAYEFIQAVNGSRLISVDTVTFPTIGLPAVQNVFLAGGLRGASSDQNFVDALIQTQRITANFVVTLASQSAGADIDTDAGSAYTIAGVNAALASHVALCSQFKMRKPRQGFASLIDTFVNQKIAAQQMGAARMSLSFLNPLVAGQSGTPAFFQPWALAVTAAAMQAAAGYKPIFNKALNIGGVKSPQGDFVVEDSAMVEDAILNGLLVAAPRDSDGVMSFVSDQTTYGVDNNFVLNSIQAIYSADTLSQTVSQKMAKAFVGQNFADVSAGVAMSYFKAVMADARRLKLIAPSDDAPTGYKNATIDIQPPAMLVSAEAKPATGLYFIPIRFLLTQSKQSATG
jgi:hypothetical protein